MLTINDLKSFARSQVRRDSNNYVGALDAWNRETYQIRRFREECNKFARWVIGTAQLEPGSYYNGRLTITETDIYYTVGQYAPTEIYCAILDYLQKTAEY